MIRSFRLAFFGFFALILTAVAAADFPQWASVQALNAVSVLSIATAENDGQTVLVARGGATALRTHDGGRTWAEFDVLGEKPIAFLSAPSDPRVFYALAGSTGLAVQPPARALYRSNDAGQTWQLVTPRIASPDGQVIDNLSVGAVPELLYGSRIAAASCFTGSCTFTGVEGYVSTDGGRTWRLSDADPTHYSHKPYAAPAEPRVAYATTVKGLHRSDDRGATWRLVWATAEIYERQVVVDRVDSSTVYVRARGDTQLWVSEDGGTTWRKTDPVMVPGPERILVADPVQAGRVYFVGQEGEIFESRDRARTWRRAGPSGGASVRMLGAVPVIGMSGERRAFYSLAAVGGVKRIEIDDGSFTLGSDLWWNPGQSGWGLTLTHHASGQLFGVWFTYDGEGMPVWRVMPGGVWNGRVFEAAIYETRGPAFFSGPFDPSRVTRRRIGEATLAFTDDNHGTFAYRLDDGSSGATPITRQLFGPANDWQLPNSADLWWNASESGWGVAVNHQFGNVFAVLFVYDEAGRPVWLVMPNSVYAYTVVGSFMEPIYRGSLFSTRGPRAGAPFDPASVAVSPVGTAALTFSFRNRDAATLDVQALGTSVSKSLTRQPF